YPKYAKPTFWFPTLFFLGFLLSIIALFFGFPYLLYCYFLYLVLVGILSLIENKNLQIALYSIVATIIQFYGYGLGFLKSFFKISILKMKPEDAFPELFFRK